MPMATLRNRKYTHTHTKNEEHTSDTDQTSRMHISEIKLCVTHTTTERQNGGR